MNDSTDGELLQAYRATGDQDAFGVLMRRHGQMVLGAAKSVLGKESDAQDIAQATFMTLARKADALESSDSVVGWLYCVAVRLARNEVRGQIRRTERETEAAMLSDGPGESSGLLEGALSVLHEELAQLSEKYRQPVLLHHVEGLSYEAGARLCGCTEKAFSVRLSRARDQLRERLARRGVALGVTALVAGLSQSASAAELPAGLVAATCAAAKGGAVSAKVAAFMESALKMLFWAKVKAVAAVCAVAVLVGGAGVGAAVILPLVLHPEITTAPLLVPEPEGVIAVAASMVLIPGGANAGIDPDTKKPYSLTVQSFLMDRCEVTKALWDEVAAWGREHGYGFGTYTVNGVVQEIGQGKAPDHPVHSVSWNDCLVWCNARSEKDGFEPVYYVDEACTAVCRTAGTAHVKPTADGYRLPTLAEWQYAARGGQSSHRFPWHDAETIDHSRANYNSGTKFPCDVSQTRGHHPTYAMAPEPYTSPVAAFPANAYGLHDMVGNVREWCADRSEFWTLCAGGSWADSPEPIGGAQHGEVGLRYSKAGFRAVRTPRGADVTHGGQVAGPKTQGKR